MESYVDMLQSSDFTLCPPGLNVEAYRIYEAMTHGSVPVMQRGVDIVQDDLQGQNYKCSDSFALLKQLDAPVAWIDHWSNLGFVLEQLHQESPRQTYKRRCGFGGDADIDAD